MHVARNLKQESGNESGQINRYHSFIRTNCMIKLADIYPSRNGKPKVDFFQLGIYDLLKIQLGFRYAKFDGKGNYLKEENGVYKIVNFHKLKDDFRDYISDHFEELEVSKEIGLDDFMNEYYKKTPIKDGNYARVYLAEDFELSDYNKHIIRLEINEKYRRLFFRNEMLEFLKQENFIEFNDELKTLNLSGPLFYKQSTGGYFLVFNNPFHGGKVIGTDFDLHKVHAKSQKELFSKKAKKCELIKIAFDLKTDVDLIREA